MFYNKMKEKWKREYREKTYFSIIQNMICRMIDANFDNNITVPAIIKCATTAGAAGVAICGDMSSEFYGMPVVGMLSWTTPVDFNGYGKKCRLSGGIANTNNSGTAFSFETDVENVAVFANYYDFAPEYNIIRFASQFAEVDNSQRVLVKNSKTVPIPVASNDAERAQYETVLQAIHDGRDTIVMTRPQSAEFLKQSGTSREDDRVLNLTDTATIEKMHFLSEYHDELVKRLAGIYGMCFNTTAKSAQATVDEIHGMDSFAWIIPEIKLELFRRGVDQYNKIFGSNVTADFSEPWKTEYEKHKKQEMGGNENAEISENQNDSGNTDRR